MSKGREIQPPSLYTCDKGNQQSYFYGYCSYKFYDIYNAGNFSATTEKKNAYENCVQNSMEKNWMKKKNGLDSSEDETQEANNVAYIIYLPLSPRAGRQVQVWAAEGGWQRRRWRRRRRCGHMDQITHPGPSYCMCVSLRYPSQALMARAYRGKKGVWESEGREAPLYALMSPKASLPCGGLGGSRL